jgi:hypothetical protein
MFQLQLLHLIIWEDDNDLKWKETNVVYLNAAYYP